MSVSERRPRTREPDWVAARAARDRWHSSTVSRTATVVRRHSSMSARLTSCVRAARSTAVVSRWCSGDSVRAAGTLTSLHPSGAPEPQRVRAATAAAPACGQTSVARMGAGGSRPAEGRRWREPSVGDAPVQSPPRRERPERATARPGAAVRARAPRLIVGQRSRRVARSVLCVVRRGAGQAKRPIAHLTVARR